MASRHKGRRSRFAACPAGRAFDARSAPRSPVVTSRAVTQTPGDPLRLLVCPRCEPRRVVLFGSYASGGPNGDSDVDLLITRARWSSSPLTMAGRMRIELGVPFPMDLIVRSEADVARRLAGGDFFMREIVEKGI